MTIYLRAELYDKAWYWLYLDTAVLVRTGTLL